MTTNYYALLTNVGAAKLANATALGEQVEITQMAVGDGNGSLPTPNPEQTALEHELRRAPLNTLTIDPVNTNQIIAEQVIPEDVGGWWIREIGLFDSDGDLIAIANCAETYKPLLMEGSGRVQVIRVILIVSSTQAVTLKIDPSVVLATREYVDGQIIQIKTYADNQMMEHVSEPDPHNQYVLQDEVENFQEATAISPPVHQRFSSDEIVTDGIRKNTTLYIEGHATLLQYVEIISASSSVADAVALFDIDLLQGVLGADITFACTGMDDINRKNATSYNVDITRNGSLWEVKANNANQKAFYAWSIRALAGGTAKFKVNNIKIFEGQVLKSTSVLDIISDSNLWGTGVSKLSNGLDYMQSIVIYENSHLRGGGVIPISPVGSKSIWQLPYDFDYFLRDIEVNASVSKIGDVLSLEMGDYYRYRQSNFMSVGRDISILATHGRARLMAGRELRTTSWEVVLAGNVSVYRAPYNADNHPDSMVRTGTKQPSITCIVPLDKKNSQKNYAFTSVNSAAEVNNAAGRCFYDLTHVYFSFKGSDTSYVYVCECDNGITYKDTANPKLIKAFAIDVYAPRVNCWNIRASGYQYWKRGAGSGRFASLHSCGSYGAATGGGFVYENMDGEVINGASDSNAVDGFNFHSAGETLISGGYSRCCGDDGISHHELCRGEVINWQSLYNAAAFGVPAYGAKVIFRNCFGTPPELGNTGKPYQNSWAVLAGQGSDSAATYVDCGSNGSTNLYSCVSQESGRNATLNIRGVLADNHSRPVIFKSGHDADTNVYLKP